MTSAALVRLSVIAAGIVIAVTGTNRVAAQELFADVRAVVEFQRAADAYAFLAPCWCSSTRTPISLSTSFLRYWRAATCGIDRNDRATLH